MYAVCICGHFGFNQSLLNGQTVKTKIVYQYLAEQLGEDNILVLDTHGGLRHVPRIVMQLFRALILCKNIVMLPAQNGVRVISPVLHLMNIFFKRKSHYVVIGGWLPEFVQGKSTLKHILRSFDTIYVETNEMKHKLEKQGFSNIVVMPNCKSLCPISPEELSPEHIKPYRICTFSRVMKEKGIEDAVNGVKMINERLNCTAFRLDIYGQIDVRQIEWFETLKKNFPEYISYKGVASFEESVEILKEYSALLFPTYYDGEGFAGTILDAFAAGVPVIATSWKYNEELIREDYTGKLIPPKDPDALAEALGGLYTSLDHWDQMRINCCQEAKKFLPDSVLKTLLENLRQ